MFWRVRVKKMSNMEILEKKRQLLEDNLDLMESDDDMSKDYSRTSHVMDESMRGSNYNPRSTGIFKTNTGGISESQSDMYQTGKEESKY